MGDFQRRQCDFFAREADAFKPFCGFKAGDPGKSRELSPFGCLVDRK
jgi:ribosome modulation factor